MDERQLFSGIAMLTALIGGCAVAVAVRSFVHHRGMAARVSSANQATRLAWLLRNGVGGVKPLARKALRISALQSFVQEGVWVCERRGLHTSEEALLSLYVVVVGVLGLLATVASRTWVGGVACACCACACSVVWLRGEQDRRREALRDAVPDALRSLGVCFRSGLSLLQTFHQVAQETKGPLADLFQRAAHRLEVGQSAQEALEALRSGSSVPELAFVAVALDVQHQTGGSMQRVLEAARETVESQIELRRSLRVQTAQARLSARVVSIMPFVLVAIFSLVSEGFLMPFFESFAGLVLLGVALGMQAAGVLVVRRILAVDVG